MAPRQTAPSFDDIIKAGRQRKKDEQLANEILGKGRRASAPRTGGHGKGNRPPSLASRVTKASQRSTSSSPVLKANGIARNGKQRPLLSHSDFLDSDLFMTEPVPNVRSNTQKSTKSFNIRGLAGPYVVVGSNFAAGTTSADIQSAMDTVVGEMMYENKACADMIITTFNNQKVVFPGQNLFVAHSVYKADGRLLHVYMKQDVISPLSRTDPNHITTLAETKALAQDRLRSISSYIDTESQNLGSNFKRAAPEVQDGSYGFEAREEGMELDINPRHESSHEGRRNDRQDDKYDYRREHGSNYERRRRGTSQRRDERYPDQMRSVQEGRRPYDNVPRQRGRGFR